MYNIHLPLWVPKRSFCYVNFGLTEGYPTSISTHNYYSTHWSMYWSMHISHIITIFVMYYIYYGVSVPSLLIESTGSMIISLCHMCYSLSDSWPLVIAIARGPCLIRNSWYWVDVYVKSITNELSYHPHHPLRTHTHTYTVRLALRWNFCDSHDFKYW